MSTNEIQRVEDCFRTNRLSRTGRLSVPGIHGVAFNIPTIDWKTGKIGIWSSIRTFDEDGRNSQVFNGTLADEFRGKNLTIGDVLRNMGLKTYNNSAIIVFDSTSPGQTKKPPEIIPVKYPTEVEARSAAFTITHGFC